MNEAASVHGVPPPVVSIVMPTFNRRALLPATVASVQAQTLREWELIIGDDGSDEETRAYLHGLAHDARIRVLWLAHSGRPAVGRNAGLREALGTYVAFLDSDDVWAPQKLERQLEVLRAHPAVKWCYTGFRQIDAAGCDTQDEHGRWTPAVSDLFEALVKGPIPIRTPSVVLATRALVIEAGGFDTTLDAAEDVDLWLRLARLSPGVALDEPLVQVRRHADNHSRRWKLVHTGRERSLHKLEQQIEPARRRLVRRERARNALQLAAAHAARGDSGTMWRTLWESATYSWSFPLWWFGLVRVPLRPHVPQGLLALYRRCRRAVSLP
jgi:glycosyltransferase involved in cell wall biosynthesis